MIVCMLAAAGTNLSILFLYFVFDHIITKKRIEINQKEWDAYSEGMTEEEKMDIFFYWLEINKQKHGWRYLYIPHI